VHFALGHELAKEVVSQLPPTFLVSRFIQVFFTVDTEAPNVPNRCERSFQRDHYQA